jgi:hypothetical protein
MSRTKGGVAVYRDEHGAVQDVARLHAQGLSRALEPGRIDLGLPLSRLTFRSQGKGPRRSRRNAAGLCVTVAPSSDSAGGTCFRMSGTCGSTSLRCRESVTIRIKVDRALEGILFTVRECDRVNLGLIATCSFVLTTIRSSRLAILTE